MTAKLDPSSPSAPVNRVHRRRRRILLACALGVALLLLSINVLAFLHARAMTHYAHSGNRTARPESLTFVDKLRILVLGPSAPRPNNRLSPSALGLDFETHRIAIHPRGSLEAWFLPADSQPRGFVILFPPYASSKHALLTSAQYFHELGFHALLVDFRGAGGSTGDITTLGVNEADDVLTACGYARSTWPDQRLILYGASMGAAAVMRAAALGDTDIDALILESPFDRLLHTIRHRFDAMHLPSWPLAELLLFWGSVQLGIDGFAHNPAEYAKSIRCPVLLIDATDDARVTRAEIDDIFNHLSGSKHLVRFDGPGHGAAASAHPEGWKRAIDQFLASNRDKPTAESSPANTAPARP